MAKVHRVSDDDGFGNWTYVSCGKPVRQDGQSWGVEATIDWTQVDCKSCLRTYIYPIGLRNTKGRRIQGDPDHEETMHVAYLSTEAIVVHPWGPSSSAKVWPALCGSLSMATTAQGDKAHCTDCLAIMSDRKENGNMDAQDQDAPNKFLEMERKREAGIFAADSLYSMLRIGPYRIATVGAQCWVLEDGADVSEQVEFSHPTSTDSLQAAVDYCIRADSLYTLTISGDLAGYYDGQNGEGTWDELDSDDKKTIARSVAKSLDGYMEDRLVAFEGGIAEA